MISKWSQSGFSAQTCDNKLSFKSFSGYFGRDFFSFFSSSVFSIQKRIDSGYIQENQLVFRRFLYFVNKYFPLRFIRFSVNFLFFFEQILTFLKLSPRRLFRIQNAMLFLLKMRRDVFYIFFQGIQRKLMRSLRHCYCF